MERRNFQSFKGNWGISYWAIFHVAFEQAPDWVIIGERSEQIAVCGGKNEPHAHPNHSSIPQAGGM